MRDDANDTESDSAPLPDVKTTTDSVRASAGFDTAVDETGPSDPHAWRATLLVWLALTTFSFVWMFVIGNTVSAFISGREPIPGVWLVPGDLWPPVFAGKVILYGGFFEPYTLNPNFVAMPLHAVVMLPVSAIVEVFGIPRPVVPAELVSYLLDATSETAGAGPVPSGSLPGTSFMPKSPFAPVAATYVLLWALPFLKTVRSLAFTLGVRRRLWTLQLTAFFLCWFPAVVMFGHLEDGLVVTLILFGVILVTRREWVQLAIALTLALSLKQTAALAVPLFFFFVPNGHRLRFAFVTLALPALLVAAVFAADTASAARSLLNPPTYPGLGGGRTAWFITSTETALRAGPFRYGAPLLALAVAWWLRRNRSVPLLLAGLAVVAATRLPFEAVLHMYYAAPFLVFAAIYEKLRRGNAVFATVFGFAGLLLFRLSAELIPDWLFWPAQVALLALAAWPVWADVARRRFGGPPEGDLVVAEAGFRLGTAEPDDDDTSGEKPATGIGADALTSERVLNDRPNASSDGVIL